MILAPGDRVDRYVVIELLGRGGMGEVYRARDPKLARPVALKILHAGRAPGTDGAARLLREARAAAALSHANVLAIFDVGEVQEPESLRGLPYIAMELVVGRSLRAHVEDGHVPLERRVEWLRDVALALGAAHQVGIVHRDVKPENVMIRSDGAVKVLDFGIARQGTSTNEAWASTLGSGVSLGQSKPVSSGASTEGGKIVGTPLYMAPEQLRGEELDGRADQFSWGVMAYMVLLGRLPWTESTEAIALVSQILSFDPPPPREVDPRIPLVVSDAVARALSKRREARFGSMEELVAAIAGHRLPAFESGAPRGNELASAMAATLSVGSAVAQSQNGTTGARLRALPWKRLSVGALACAAIVGGVAAYRAVRAPHVHLCLDVEIAQSGPRCLFEVSPDVVGKRISSTMRVTEQSGRVLSVETLNFAGLVDDASNKGYSRIEVVRDDAGAVRELVLFDRYGGNVERQVWSDGGRRIDYVDLDGKTPRHADRRVTSLRVEYDAQGHRTKVLYLGSSGHPRACDDVAIEVKGGEIYGIALEYGKTPGVPVKQTSLGYDGAPAPNSKGIVFARRVDDGTLWGDVSVFDASDRPIAPEGVHSSRTLHDAYESTGASFLGLHGEPVTDLTLSFHESRLVWDPVKRTTESTTFDERGRPLVVRRGWYTEVRSTYDAHGFPTLIEFMDGQGNRVTTGWGISAERTSYDEHDVANVFESLDTSGALAQGEDACARMERTRSPHGAPVEDRCYGEGRHLAAWKFGGAISRATYDERDLQLTWSSYDADDHPIATATGFALERKKYDRQRNPVETAYFGPDGRPIVTSDGFSIKRQTFDENDDLVAVSYFDANDAPAPFESSYATKRLKNDERGLVVEEAYLGVHGDPAVVKEGYATVEETRDRNGDVVEESYLGKDGGPVVREGGFARRTTTYDVTRRPVEVALFDVAGRPTRGTAGWAIERTTYDERGVVIRVDHLDAARKPALDRDGRASIVKTSDARGNLTEETSLDVAGSPVATTDGYATKKSAYDERDEVVEEALFGADGRPISGKAGWSIRRVRYGEAGSVVGEAFFGPAHEPVVPKELTYASTRQRFDDRHALVETAYFDERGVPSKGPDGVATVRYTRDAYGRAIGTAYFDGMGVAAASRDGRIAVRARFDDEGRLVGERFVDAAGAPRAGSDGCFGRETKYDAQGHTLEESCLDAKDAPALSTEGWAIRRTLHDALGNDVEVATYAPDGALRADKDGIARKKSRFGERNELLETTYFDASDKPARDASGAHAMRFTYDDSGKKTGERGFDERDRPLAVKSK